MNKNTTDCCYHKKLFFLWLGVFNILSAGTSAIYPLYSYLLKSKFNLSLKSVNLYSSFINIGNNATFLLGYVYDKYGLKISSIISFFLLPCSYIILAIIFYSSLNSIFFGFLLLIAFLIGQGASLLYTSTLATSLKQFAPELSGLVVGLIASNRSLGSLFFISLKDFLDPIEINSYFIVVVIFVSCSIFLCLTFFSFSSNKDNYSVDPNIKQIEITKEKYLIMTFIFIDLISVVTFISLSFAKNLFSFNFPFFFVILTAHSLKLILVFALMNSTSFENYVKNKIQSQKLQESTKQVENQIPEKTEQSKDFNEIEDSMDNKDETITIKQNKQLQNDNTSKIKKKSLVIRIINNRLILNFFVIITFTMGTIMSNLNNIKFISYAISQDKVKPAGYSLSYFAFNSIGRIITGIIFNKYVNKDGFFSFIFIIIFIGIISQSLGYLMNAILFYLSIGLIGFTDGSLMTFNPLFCKKYFDINEMGTILGVITSGKAIGSLIIGTLIFTYFYQKNMKNNICEGPECFRGGYMVNICFLMFSLVIAYFLNNYVKKREMKKKIIAAKTIKNSNEKDAESNDLVNK